MRHVMLVSMAAALGAGCGGNADVASGSSRPKNDHATSPPGAAPQSSGWTSAPALAGDLAEEYDLGEYRIRPPKGFELKSDDQMPAGLGRLVVWQAADDLRTFSVAFFTVPEDEGPASPQVIRELDRTKGVTNYTESPAERGTLAGLSFEQCTAEFTYRNSGARMSGVVCSQGNNRRGILIKYVGPNTEPESRRAVAVAAIRSFRKS